MITPIMLVPWISRISVTIYFPVFIEMINGITSDICLTKLLDYLYKEIVMNHTFVLTIVDCEFMVPVVPVGMLGMLVCSSSVLR